MIALRAGCGFGFIHCFNLTLEMLIVDRELTEYVLLVLIHSFNLTLEMLIVDRSEQPLLLWAQLQVSISHLRCLSLIVSDRL